MSFDEKPQAFIRIQFLIFGLGLDMGHRDTKNADILGHRDTETVDLNHKKAQKGSRLHPRTPKIRTKWRSKARAP